MMPEGLLQRAEWLTTSQSEGEQRSRLFRRRRWPEAESEGEA
jgi:hypothetical protein